MAMCRCAAIFLPVKLVMPRAKRASAGTIMVDRRKARPRIFSRYSRRAMSSMLRDNRLGIGLASHGLNENLFERGLDQFKAIDSGGRRGLMQQLLRVAVRFELDFSVAGVVVGLGNLVATQKIGAAFKLHDDVVALVAAFDLAHAAAEHGLAMIDEADGVA